MLTSSLPLLAFGATATSAAKYPPLSSSTGFQLYANITNQTANVAAFSPPLGSGSSMWGGVAVHVGAGRNDIVLASNTSDLGVFFQNGTGAGSGLVADGDAYPYSVRMDGPLETYPEDWTLYQVELDIGGATATVGIDAAGAVVAWADKPAGTFVVCNDTLVAYTMPQYPVRFVDLAAGETVPGRCVPIALLAQCATLTDVAANGTEYGTDNPQEVSCFADVRSVVWSEY